MIKVFNPIYDSVFKFVMQNDRAAKFLLGSILNKKILSLKMKNNDYVVTTKNGITVLRIDFGATIQNEGEKNPEVVTIELQKAVAKGEIMRFRKYLGFHYQNDDNCNTETIINRGKKVNIETPYHIYAIYILGHSIGDNLKYAVIKDKHVFHDDEGNEISIPKTNKFVSGLTHDTIIVQIPYVKKNAKNVLEELLSIFDQSQVVEKKYIELDDTRYSSPEYQELMKTLLKATASQKVKGELELEEEIEQKWTEKENEISGLKNELEETQNQLAQKDNQLAQKDNQLISLIKMLKELGLSNEEIAKKTGLSIEEIKKVKE
ncbi:MAG: DUF2802 domain-containing protein [Bacteroidales bacterium]|nr:DUF2802 domain-containing protein [Bacteroidales bacterium]